MQTTVKFRIRIVQDRILGAQADGQPPAGPAQARDSRMAH